jgi:hypothetical protein
MSLWIAVCALLLVVSNPVGGGAPEERVSVRREAYHGWTDCYRMSNGTIDLVYVPQIGRLMRYGYVNGPNMLWENPDLRGKTAPATGEAKEWANFGGDKLWPAPQEKWGWPPDPSVDPGVQSVQVLPDQRLRITGQASKKHGIRFVREITLAPTGTQVTLTNTMENTSVQEVNWSIWEVAQVDAPDWAEIPIDLDSRLPSRYSVFNDATIRERGLEVKGSLQRGGASLRLTRHPQKGGKIGTDAKRQWARALVQGVTFSLQGAYERGASYPDGGCLQEIYSNADPAKYMELELLGPVRHLVPGEKAVFTTRWRLEKQSRN